MATAPTLQTKVTQPVRPPEPPAKPPAAAPEKVTLEEGKPALMRAVYGYMAHPWQVPLSFDVDRVTKVVVDRWVVIQFEAGKLRIED